MKAEKYIDAVVKKIKCSGSKREEIKKELLSEWTQRMEQGETLEEIIKEAGTEKEMAAAFNETLSGKEKKKYFFTRILAAVALAVFVIGGMVGLSKYYMPQPLDIENSMYFDKQEVEETMKHTIELVENGDYEALRDEAIEDMKAVLTKETVDKAKLAISDKWGERKSFGTPYMQEMIQKGRHYVVGEITVTYEFASATYRITYDETGKLAGIYMR